MKIVHHCSVVAETPGVESLAPLPTQRTHHPNWTQRTDNLLGVPEDLTIISSDLVHFHVHQTYLLAMSSNMFNGLLPLVSSQRLEEETQDSEEQRQNVLNLPESGAVLNILFFATYGGTPTAGQVTASDISLSNLSLALEALKTYGIPVQTAVSAGSLTFGAFASHCQNSPSSALQVYANAAAHAPGLHPLAVFASQFLLSLSLSTVTEEIACTMGPVYLRRLFSLHLERVQEFKQLMLGLPQPHGPEPPCNDTEGRALREAWALATAYLTWAAAPAMPSSRIDDVMASVMDRCPCNECKERLRSRFLDLKQGWTLVKVRSLPRHLNI